MACWRSRNARVTAQASTTLPVPTYRIPLLIAATTLAFGLTACRDQSVAHYRIDKPAGPATSSGVASRTALAPAGAAAATGPELAWSAPDHWPSLPATTPRRATYVRTGENGAAAELAVTVFPGDVGGELANVNRWRGQVQLDPVSSDTHAATVERLQVGELEIALVDFTGGTAEMPIRLLGAIVPLGEATWFFKFTGSPSVIERERAAFRALLQTVHSSSNNHACCDS
jgi:hypothetical protein